MSAKFEISVGSIDLKPKNVTFLADHLWSQYVPEMKAVHDKIVAFLSDFNKHPVIDVAYNVSAESDKIHEIFKMRVDRIEVAEIAMHQYIGEFVDGNEPIEVMKDKLSMLAEFDNVGKAYRGVRYDSGTKDIEVQSVFHNMRRLVADVAGNLESEDVCFDAYVKETGGGFTLFVFPKKDNHHYISVRVWTPMTAPIQMVE